MTTPNCRTPWIFCTIAIISLSLTGCGTNKFTGKSEQKKSENAGLSDDAVAEAADSEGAQDGKIDTKDDNNAPATTESSDTGEAAETTDDGSETATQEEIVDYEIEGATEEESQALQNCLNAFTNHPFGSKIENFRKIDAAVSIFGNSTPINDTLKTDEPSLILIVAGVNIAGKPTYNMLNPNGYYCIKNAVNIATNLKVNVSCSAELADASFNVNIASNVDDSVARNGVHIASSIELNNIEDDKASYPCLR